MFVFCFTWGWGRVLLLDPFFFRKNALKSVSRSARSSFSVHEWLENVAQIMPSFFFAHFLALQKYDFPLD
jgi:hypothetical protein